MAFTAVELSSEPSIFIITTSSHLHISSRTHHYLLARAILLSFNMFYDFIVVGSMYI